MKISSLVKIRKWSNIAQSRKQTRSWSRPIKSLSPTAIGEEMIGAKREYSETSPNPSSVRLVEKTALSPFVTLPGESYLLKLELTNGESGI